MVMCIVHISGSNFASSEIDEDNMIDQLIANNKPVVFMGDDTWDSLYPSRYERHFTFDGEGRGVSAPLTQPVESASANI